MTFKAISHNGISHSNGTGSVGGGPNSEAGRDSPAPASPRAVIPDEEYEHNNVVFIPAPLNDYRTIGAASTDLARVFPPDIHFSKDELALRPEDLYKLLKSQLRWAIEDGEELKREVYELEEKKKQEWASKELVLENMLEGEAEGVLRRAVRGTEDEGMARVLKRDVMGAEGLSLRGQETPWWRLPRREREDAMEGIEAPAQQVLAV